MVTEDAGDPITASGSLSTRGLGGGLTSFEGEIRPEDESAVTISSLFFPVSAEVARCSILIDGDRVFRRDISGEGVGEPIRREVSGVVGVLESRMTDVG
jgi:hypothetical protein